MSSGRLSGAAVKSRRWKDGGFKSNFREARKWQTPTEPAKLFARRKYLMHIRSLLALGLLLVHALVSAQTADAPSPLSLDEARAQRARGKALKVEAEKTYQSEKAVCQSKAIAINCMSSAKEKRIEAVRSAEAIEREGHKAEREAHKREVDAKAAKRAVEAPGREAKEQADVERYRDKEIQKAADRERNLTEEAAKLESRRSKLAAEKAARQKRVEEQSKEDAKRAAKAPENARKRAEREKDHADRVKKIDERARQYDELLKRRKADEVARQAAALEK
jgi:hypothetical protein